MSGLNAYGNVTYNKTFETKGTSLTDFYRLTVGRTKNKGMLELNEKGGLKCVGHRFWNVKTPEFSTSASGLRQALLNAVSAELDKSFDKMISVAETEKKSAGGGEFADAKIRLVQQQMALIKEKFAEIINPSSNRVLKRRDIRQIVLNTEALVRNVTMERLKNMTVDDLVTLDENAASREKALRYANPERGKIGDISDRDKKMDAVWEGLKKPGLANAGHVLQTLDAKKTTMAKLLEAGGIALKTMVPSFKKLDEQRQDLNKNFIGNPREEWENLTKIFTDRNRIEGFQQVLCQGERLAESRNVFYADAQDILEKTENKLKSDLDAAKKERSGNGNDQKVEDEIRAAYAKGSAKLQRALFAENNKGLNQFNEILHELCPSIRLESWHEKQGTGRVGGVKLVAVEGRSEQDVLDDLKLLLGSFATGGLSSRFNTGFVNDDIATNLVDRFATKLLHNES